MSYGREIKCPFCASTEVTFVALYRYICLKCEKEFDVRKNPEILLLHEGPTETSYADKDTIPLRTRFRPSGC